MKPGKRTSQFIRFIKPIVEILKQSGGSGLSSEVTDNVIELMKIPETELSETIKNGESRIRNQVAWARMYLVNSGYIDSSVRGTWKLTDKGLSSVIDDEEVQDIVKKGSQASKSTVEAK
jgi:restriction system protein